MYLRVDERYNFTDTGPFPIKPSSGNRRVPACFPENTPLHERGVDSSEEHAWTTHKSSITSLLHTASTTLYCTITSTHQVGNQQVPLAAETTAAGPKYPIAATVNKTSVDYFPSSSTGTRSSPSELFSCSTLSSLLKDTRQLNVSTIRPPFPIPLAPSFAILRPLHSDGRKGA
jgi:hypothetical protein